MNKRSYYELHFEVFGFGINVIVFCFLSGKCYSNSYDRGWKGKGIETESAVVYKGIPYAAPPVGDLRWAKPQDVQNWDTLMIADTFSKASIQAKHDANDGVYGTEFYREDPEMGEDCLYLNVWTPRAHLIIQRRNSLWQYGFTVVLSMADGALKWSLTEMLGQSAT